MAKLATNLDLNISGYKVKPGVGSNPLVSTTGEDKETFSLLPSYEIKQKMLQNRYDMAGGFKIPKESFDENKDQYENEYTHHPHEDDYNDESNIFTRDEIIKELNLRSNSQPGDEIKGSLTKTSLANELVDNITRELEKLKRHSENLQGRKDQYTKPPPIAEETFEEKNYKIRAGLELQGCNVIHAENERVQAQRHQTGQLGGLGAIDLEEVMYVRNEATEELKGIEQEYYKDVDRRLLSDVMYKKLQGYNNNTIEDERERRRREKDKEYYELEARANEIKANREFEQSSYNPDRTWVRRISVKRDETDAQFDEAELLARDKREVAKPPTEAELKRMLYEAKFAKYRVNRKMKHEFDSEKKVAIEFDLYLKGKESSNTKAKCIDWDDIFSQKLKPAKFSTDYAVYQSDYDMNMFETVRRKAEDLSKEDKLTFSVLKWIYNALKKKDGTVNRRELTDQLDQNIDIMQSLGFESADDVNYGLSMLRTQQTGKLTWEEFLDFFGSRTESFKASGESWWKTEQEGVDYYIPINQQTQSKLDPKARKEQLSSQAYNKMVTKPDGNIVFEANSQTQAKMKKLAESRVNKLIVEDIEKELHALKGSRKRSKSGKNNESINTAATLGQLASATNPELFKTGPVCVLHSSHMEIMHEIYKETDKYNDQIVNRSSLIDNIRNNKTVQKFLDQKAIKIDRKHKLSFEEVLKEIYKDHLLHNDSDEEGEFNHREFITWEEFVDFFENYNTPEDRLKVKENEKRNRKKFKTDREKRADKQQKIEEEKERRLEILPRFRKDDIIDAEEEYLDIIFDVFDGCTRSKENHNAIDALQYFMVLKKDPKIVKINDTIAREPDGQSRVATETFVEVFYRIEKEHEDRYIDWPTILEYFTKRGRPLTQEEVHQRKHADTEEEDQFEREQKEKRDEEEEFFKEHREGNQSSSPTRRTHFEIDEGGVDIEDMEVVGGGRPDFTSTSRSKKKVSFKDSTLDRGSTIGRPKTTISRSDNTLAKESLAGRDYANHKKEKAGKSTDRHITVPEPFKFDTRDMIRPKSIRERKVDEMIEKQRIEEDKLLGFKFRAKQPPKEIITPMFNQIKEKNELRRKEVKENSIKIMKEKEKPFSFYERDVANYEAKKNQSEYVNAEFKKPAFKANEVPVVCSVELYKIMIDKDKKEREIRVKKNAEENLKKSKLPPRMEQHEKDKKDKKDKEGLMRKSASKGEEDLSRFGTFEPNKAKPVPDFDRIQRNFQETLDRKKSSQKLTNIKPFKFDDDQNMKKGSKTKASLRTHMDTKRPQSKAGKIPNYGKPKYNPKSTDKQTGLEERRRREIELKMKSEMDQIKENKERHRKQNKLKGQVQSLYLSLDNTKQKEKDKKENLFQKVTGMIASEKQTKQLIKEIKKRGRDNPYLIERYNNSLKERERLIAGLNAVKIVKNTMVRNGLDPSKHLSDEQKDRLADAEFLAKHKPKKTLAK
jgi:hypothetical protein